MGKTRVRFIDNEQSKKIGNLMRTDSLHSVCQSARCPNRYECWAQGTASFMVLGEYCTRSCRFCAIKTMAKPPVPDPQEPVKLAKAIGSLNLRYVVITSVTRDDLPDGGAMHIAECVGALKRWAPDPIIETLVPDFRADTKAMDTIISAAPHVVSHNIETVERLTPRIRDPRASYRQSLDALRYYRERSKGKIITKSGIMVGLGETETEVVGAMKGLRSVGVDIVTIGQYLRPSTSPRHVEVEEYLAPERFKRYEELGYGLGFKYVASGPLVRSSYMAAEPFVKGIFPKK